MPWHVLAIAGLNPGSGAKRDEPCEERMTREPPDPSHRTVRQNKSTDIICGCCDKADSLSYQARFPFQITSESAIALPVLNPSSPSRVPHLRGRTAFTSLSPLPWLTTKITSVDRRVEGSADGATATVLAHQLGARQRLSWPQGMCALLLQEVEILPYSTMTLKLFQRPIQDAQHHFDRTLQSP